MVSGMDTLMPEPTVISGEVAKCCTVIDSGATMYAWAEYVVKIKRERHAVEKRCMINEKTGSDRMIKKAAF
jgi:hypothetical protein